MPMVRNAWYPACPASRLGEGAPRPVTLLDETIVLYRDAEGRAHALEDRCCHRGVQLSLGCVTPQGHLACGYHGWEYDGSGRCVHVPSLCTGTPVPCGFRVRAYPCIERDFYVWVWMGDGEPATAQPSPIKDAAVHPWRQGSVSAGCCADFLIENILDSSHVPFVHKGSHPAYFFNKLRGFVEYDYETRITDNGLVVFYPPTKTAEAPFIEDVAASYLHFELPNRIYVFQRGSKTHFHLVLHLVPQGASSSCIEWIMVDREGQPGSVQWEDAPNLTLNQDRAILESAQINYDRAGADFERSVPADYPLLTLRKVIALARTGQWEARRAELPQRKLVRVRQ